MKLVQDCPRTRFEHCTRYTRSRGDDVYFMESAVSLTLCREARDHFCSRHLRLRMIHFSYDGLAYSRMMMDREAG